MQLSFLLFPVACFNLKSGKWLIYQPETFPAREPSSSWCDSELTSNLSPDRMDSESDGETKTKKRKMENYTAKDFESLRHSEQDRFWFDISDIMCNDSECGGDSDADDAFDKKRMLFQGHTSTPIKDSEAQPSSSRIRGNNVPNYLSDSDSECVDDSDADPTYDPDEDIGNKSFFFFKRVNQKIMKVMTQNQKTKFITWPTIVSCCRLRMNLKMKDPQSL
ncbi:hypothetical protein J6590_032117 [Homalodisca vitripennis]|nr:hypothetical protein J6590_032117 [Homalodisca vitripennis]